MSTNQQCYLIYLPNCNLTDVLKKKKKDNTPLLKTPRLGLFFSMMSTDTQERIHVFPSLIRSQASWGSLKFSKIPGSNSLMSTKTFWAFERTLSWSEMVLILFNCLVTCSPSQSWSEKSPKPTSWAWSKEAVFWAGCLWRAVWTWFWSGSESICSGRSALSRWICHHNNRHKQGSQYLAYCTWWSKRYKADWLEQSLLTLVNLVNRQLDDEHGLWQFLVGSWIDSSFGVEIFSKLTPL